MEQRAIYRSDRLIDQDAAGTHNCWCSASGAQRGAADDRATAEDSEHVPAASVQSRAGVRKPVYCAEHRRSVRSCCFWSWCARCPVCAYD